MGSRLEANSTNVRKRIDIHEFHDEEGEEYNASTFGGFSDYMRRKKIKLQNLDEALRQEAKNNPPIFRGIVAHVNGYTQPSLQDLHHMIVSYGGGFMQYLDGKTFVTHVIASSLTPKKKVEFAKYRIVKPAWVVDSIQAGQLLPWDSYRVVDEGVKQKVLGFENGTMVSQTNAARQGYRDQTDTSWYTSQVKQEAAARGEDLGSVSLPLSDREGAEELLVSQNEPRYADLAKEEASQKVVEARSVTPTNNPQDDDAHETMAQHVRDTSRESIPITTTDDSLAPPKLLKKNSSADSEHAVKDEQPKLSAEEHNRLLLQNPHLAKSSTANPDFINQYYRESRLHHLSTWKAELKAQLQARAQEKAVTQAARHRKIAGQRRYVMHVDFDSFFAAVSLRKKPEWQDKPVAIAHGSGPGSEIASCNYPARNFGVKNGMWMKTALESCPDLNVLPYDFKAYEEASRHFYDAVLATDGIVQSVSIDEALVDISQQCIEAGGTDGQGGWENAIHREQHKASEVAQQLREHIKEKTGCHVSIGIGNNILLARCALRKAKPAGQFLITPEAMLDYIGQLPVENLPGVAYSLGAKLRDLNVIYVKDIRELTKERLMTSLGPKTGEKLYEYARGIDKAEVGEQVVRKSVSAEVNWGIRFITQQQAEDFVQALCDELSKRLIEQFVKGRQMTMKIMKKAADAGMDPPKNLGHGKCDTFNKSVALGVATHDRLILGREAIAILRGYGFSPGELRGLGVQMTKLEPTKPMPEPGSGVGPADSSQRRLQFKQSVQSVNEKQSPARNASKDSESKALQVSRKPKLRDEPDPIEDVKSPEISKPPSSISGMVSKTKIDSAGSDDDAALRPLNVMGTQFIVPSQIDPAVLAELPQDIRDRLKAAGAVKSGDSEQINFPNEFPESDRSRSASPAVSARGFDIPNQSQLDPEILAALPADVRSELEAHYRHPSNVRGQSLLPQSPRKDRQVSTRKPPLTPTKKNKISTLIGRGRPRTNKNAASTLTQSNFVALKRQVNDDGNASDSMTEEISESFLAELPEDIRIELLAEQKRARMRAKSGLNLEQRRKRHQQQKNATWRPGQQFLKLPSKPQRPTFTSRRLWKIEDLREAMDAWIEEYSNPEEDGPFEEDVKALSVYLERVVEVEMDLAKAVAIVDWIAYVVNDKFGSDGTRLAMWHPVLDQVKLDLQAVVKRRGLSAVEFADG